jgi:transcriptional regulator with XRE-family HTH domain
MNKNYIGENIRIYRERKNITQRELADRIGKTWEMVSRYERGASSPLKQIDSLADALDIDVKDLFKDPTEQRERYDFNRVPFFTSIPKDMDFENQRSYVYYTAPDWVLDLDRKCFVIDTDLVKIETEKIVKGKLFVSLNYDVLEGDIILKREDDSLVVKELLDEKEEGVIGKILAQEISFMQKS